MTFQR